MIVAVALFTSIKLFNQNPKIEIKIADTTLKVWVADTGEERAKGLSGKNSIKEDEGMLFIFDQTGEYGFWMKGMNFPIDIVWIDGERRIIGMEETILPESYPKVFSPKEPVLYVLEVRAGYILRHHLDIGGEMFLSP